MTKTSIKFAAMALLAGTVATSLPSVGSAMTLTAGQGDVSQGLASGKTSTTPVRNETGFWSCWAARDFQGNGTSFTGGCWDAYMLTAMPASTDAKLHAFANDYQRDQGAAKSPAEHAAVKARFQNGVMLVDLAQR